MLLAGLTAVDGRLVPERCVQNHLEAELEPSWLHISAFVIGQCYVGSSSGATH